MLLSSTIEESNVSSTKSAAVSKVSTPKRHKAKLLVWTDLSVTTVDRLNESASPDHVKQVLADIFMLDHYKTNPRSAIIMELFYNTLRFAKGENFSSEKTSAFFSILKSLFQVCIETPFENENYACDYFRDLVKCHSVNCPPNSISLFTPDDVMKITQYTAQTFFRHYDMYKYAFTSEVQLDLSFNYVGTLLSVPSSEDNVARATKHEDTTMEGQQTTSNTKQQINNVQDLKQEVLEMLSTEAEILNEMIKSHIKAAADCLETKLGLVIKPTNDDNHQQITPVLSDDPNQLVKPATDNDTNQLVRRVTYDDTNQVVKPPTDEDPNQLVKSSTSDDTNQQK